MAGVEALGHKGKLEIISRVPLDSREDLSIAYTPGVAEPCKAIEKDIAKVAQSDMTSVLLPGVSFFLNYGYAPARKLIDAGANVALSTDYNPGSSNIANLNLIMSLAVLKMKMTIEETISAVTINAANALLLSEMIGSLENGKKADLAVFNTNNYTDIVYNVGKNLNEIAKDVAAKIARTTLYIYRIIPYGSTCWSRNINSILIICNRCASS